MEGRLPLLLPMALLGGLYLSPILSEDAPNIQPDSPGEVKTRPESSDPQPSALELHHARLQYRELYDLSQNYREMLLVLKQNYGTPSALASGSEGEATPGDKESSENSQVEEGSVQVEDCPANAYMEYSRSDITKALTTVRVCVQKQRALLTEYGKAMAQDTDHILDRLSGRIQSLMGESNFSTESMSSRKLQKGRSMLQFSLRVSSEARSNLEENPEMAIARMRVARFQAIQGLILLETTYDGEQKLKQEFETALLDAEGKVYIKPLDEDRYRKPAARDEKPAQ